jgi:hypothetical protein
MVAVYRRVRSACCLHHQGDESEDGHCHTRRRENLKSQPSNNHARFLSTIVILPKEQPSLILNFADSATAAIENGHLSIYRKKSVVSV